MKSGKREREKSMKRTSNKYNSNIEKRAHRRRFRVTNMTQILTQTPVISFLTKRDVNSVSKTNRAMHELLNQEKEDVVQSDTLSQHIADFNMRLIEKLVVILVEGPWEQPEPGFTFAIPSLKHLVLRSDPSPRRQSRSKVTGPKPLEQLMTTGLHILDISGLTNADDLNDVVATLPQPIDELRMGTFGLQYLGNRDWPRFNAREWRSLFPNIEILVPIRSIHLTITMDAEGDLNVKAMNWLHTWATQERARRNTQKLTLVFPMYNRWIIKLLDSFESIITPLRHGVHYLYIDIQNMDVNYIETLNHKNGVFPFTPDVFREFYRHSGTETHLMIHIEDMKETTANWLRQMTKNLIMDTTYLETKIDLSFSPAWNRTKTTDTVNAVKRTIKKAIRSHVKGIFIRNEWNENTISEKDLFLNMPDTPILQIDVHVKDKMSDLLDVSDVYTENPKRSIYNGLKNQNYIQYNVITY